MRDIKFRGQRKDNKEWVYGDLTQSYPKDFPPEIKITWWVKGREYYSTNPIEKKTVGQYTGLKDKNGKEIYEGDIVKQEYSAGPYGRNGEEYWEGYHLGVVRITATEGACMRNPYIFDEIEDTVYKINQYKNVVGYRAEVIGNIHQNPELLEVEE